MSKQRNAESIYMRLRAGGLTHEAACAMLGNWEAESALRPDNVEDRLHKNTGMTDAEYTAAVDDGSYPNFPGDGYGYGYYQITYRPRKMNFLSFAKEMGASIGDSAVQTAFAIHELMTENEYKGLYSFLCSTNDLYTATSRICKEFERPTVNNVAERYGYAKTWEKVLSGQTLNTTQTAAPPAIITRTDFTLSFRYLSIGCKGEDVRTWQRLLMAAGFDLGRYGADGVFGTDTLNATKAYQRSIKQTADGVVGPATYGYMLGLK